MIYIAFYQSIDVCVDVGTRRTIEAALELARRLRPNPLFTAGARRSNLPKPQRDHAVVSRPVWHA